MVYKNGAYRGVSMNICLFLSDIVTEENVRNLVDLADLLRKVPPPKFDMSSYAHVDLIQRNDEIASLKKLLPSFAEYGNPSPYEIFLIGENKGLSLHTCGTSCCAVGTAAFHGMGKEYLKINPDIDDDNGPGWDEYVNIVFGFSGGKVWDYLFSGDWGYEDNTPEGAAARILCLLQNSVNVFDILDSVDELDFTYNTEVVERLIHQYQPYKDVSINPA